ncbi:MAG: transporter substrate-binding domain-containing protein [Aliarcobacter sp.]
MKKFMVYGIKILKSFKEKEVDIITSISYKKERESFTKFTNPYYQIPIMIFVRDNFGKYEGIKSLEGKKVGILKDVFYANELTKFKNIQLVAYETYEEITKALVFGRIDALIQNLPNINYLIKKTYTQILYLQMN